MRNITLTDEQKDQLWDRWMERLVDPEVPVCAGWYRNKPGGEQACALGQLALAGEELGLADAYPSVYRQNRHDTIRSEYIEHWGQRLAAALGIAEHSRSIIMVINDDALDAERKETVYGVVHGHYVRAHNDQTTN